MSADVPAPLTTDDAVVATTALIDDAARDRLTVRGADAASYLQSQLAQELRDLAVGAARWTFVLDPTGKVDALARIQRSGDEEFVVDTDAGFGESMTARIKRFMIRVDVETELVEAEASEPDPGIEAKRIAAGWPRMGAEISPGETIPATTGVVLVAVNFTKGCYPGQELVERMDSRGADAPRRLVVLDLATGLATGAVAGDPVVVDDAEVGVITSVSASGDVAIASVKRGAEVGRAPAHLG